MKTMPEQSPEINEIYINPRDFYANELEPWDVLWDRNKSLYQNVYSIIKQSVFLPNPQIALPITSVYTLIPSKWAKILPILFCWGEKGSGKSTLATIASLLHGRKTTFSPRDTFASIRNALDKMRWIEPSLKDFEREGAILCWDNIHIKTLEIDEKIYQMLLFGYSRNTEKIMIAGSNGDNKEFYVFCPKIISSIEPIHLHPGFEELQRRLLIIQHKQWEKFSYSDKQFYGDIDIKDKLDLDSISWEGIEKEFNRFWDNIENCKLYAKYRGILTKRGKKSFTIPEHIKGEYWTISVDIICTGLVVGAWASIAEAIEHITQYWEWHETHTKLNSSATIQHLRIFIDEEVGSLMRLNEELNYSNNSLDITINPARLKDKLAQLQARGELDTSGKMKEIVQVMGQLGWRLSPRGWIQIK